MATKKQKYDTQWGKTAENKIKAIEKALKISGEKQAEFLKQRISFWKSGVHKRKVDKK